jgi:formate dehydrogenase subunit gamma
MAMAVPAEGVQMTLESKITRFDVHQIIQHAGLMTSFILLVVTGLPLKFSTLGISQWWILVWGGLDTTRSVHHFAAWMMAFVSLYHVVYLLYSLLVLKKPFPIGMLPSRNDAIQYYHEMAYYLGIKKEKPLVGRFNWKEKFDYWAIFWGIPVMFVSGFIMMYPVLITKFLPGWVVPAALVAHSDEAMLALIWIFLVHIFFNHFSPGIFPLNTSIFTGKVARERYQREHSLEYEKLLGTDKAEDNEQVPPQISL